MPEKQNTLVFAGQKARAKNRVCTFLQKKRDHLQQIARVVFEVRIVNNGKLGICVLKSGSESRTLALVSLLAEKDPLKLAAPGFFFDPSPEAEEGRWGLICGAIVHHDYLHPPQQWGLS